MTRDEMGAFHLQMMWSLLRAYEMMMEAVEVVVTLHRG